MAKRSILIMVLLILLVFTGCDSSKESIENFDEENSELKQINAQLVSENTELRQNNTTLESQNKELGEKIKTLEKNLEFCKASSEKSDEVLELAKNEANVLRSTLYGVDKKSGILNMFNPYNLKAGDKVGSFTVENIYAGPDMESAIFDGPFTVTGDLVTNMTGSSDFSMMIYKSDFYKLPCSVRFINNEVMYIDLVNSKDEISSLLGNDFKEPGDWGEFKLNITARFSQFNYHFKYETDYTSTAKLVKLVSVNK